MKNANIVAVILFCIMQTVSGQLDTFNLSLYKLPDLRRSQLDFTMDLAGTQWYTHTVSDNQAAYRNSLAGLAGNARLDYLFYRNSERLQSEQRCMVLVTPDFRQRNLGDTMETKTFIMQSATGYNGTNRIYFRNQFFFEPDVAFYGSAARNEFDNGLYDTRDFSGEYYVDLEVPLLAGKGRIEPVQDARLAIYILEELYKEGRLSRMPGNDEILDFAAVISESKNERFFDHRIREMVEIEKVDSFLQSRALIDKADARYYTTVKDNWDYSSGPVRQAGRRFTMGIVPDVYYDFSQNRSITRISEITDKSSRFSSGIKVLASYEAEKPVNLHWQRSLSASLNCGYNRNVLSYITSNYEYRQGTLSWGGNFRYAVGYYPNSRTDLGGVFYFHFVQYGQKQQATIEAADRFRYFACSPQIALNLNYYISPQARLNLNYMILYNYTDNQTEDNQFVYSTFYRTNILQQNLSARFLYSFF